PLYPVAPRTPTNGTVERRRQSLLVVRAETPPIFGKHPRCPPAHLTPISPIAGNQPPYPPALREPTWRIVGKQARTSRQAPHQHRRAKRRFLGQDESLARLSASDVNIGTIQRDWLQHLRFASRCEASFPNSCLGTRERKSNPVNPV